MFVGAIKDGLRMLVNPGKEFEELNKKSFEYVVSYYVQLLVASGLLAAITSFVYSLIRAVYLSTFFDVGIQYLRMVNYSVGRSTSLLFFYLFAGTFLLFFVSLVLKPFFRMLRYTSALKILLYSLTPVLLFGWFLPNPLPLGVWSLFLAYVGIKEYKPAIVKKDSIERRE